jgi:hypothetical protein
VNGGKKRTKIEKQQGKWLIGFCSNLAGPFGLALLWQLLVKSVRWLFNRNVTGSGPTREANHVHVSAALIH